MPLSYVYEVFPHLLQPIAASSPKVLDATRAQRWRERAERIRDDSLGWSVCMREWRQVVQDIEADPTSCLRSEAFVDVCGDQADHELRNLARRIWFESSQEERARMPSPTCPSVEFVHWARREARWQIHGVGRGGSAYPA